MHCILLVYVNLCYNSIMLGFMLSGSRGATKKWEVGRGTHGVTLHMSMYEVVLCTALQKLLRKKIIVLYG